MRPWSSWVRAAVLGPVILLSSVALGCTQAEDPLEVEPAVIRAVRYHVEPARTRVWFKTSGTMFYTHYSPDPLTLVIDLPGVDITAISDRIVVGSQEVESIVATRLDGGGDKSLSRIEIKLSSLIPYQISATEHALTVLFEGEGSPAEAPPIGAVPSAVPTDTTTMSASTDDIVDTDDAVATETVEPEPTTEPAEQRPVSAPSVPVLCQNSDSHDIPKRRPTALGDVANTDTKLLICSLFQKSRFLAQDDDVVHELVHLRHRGHSRSYWQAVGRVMPDYERRREELRQCGTGLVW